jgi:predicted RNase H-like HicB family nuclease
MGPGYTAVVLERTEWWIGWIAGISGINSQGETQEELLRNLRSALHEALELNRAGAVAAAKGEPYEEVPVSAFT